MLDMSTDPETSGSDSRGSWLVLAILLCLWGICGSLGWVGLYKFGLVGGISGGLIGIALYRILAPFPPRTVLREGMWIWLVFICLGAMAASIGTWFYLQGK